jgi:hypothetical protein
VEEVLAGFVCGFGVALAVTPIAAVALVRARVTSPLLQQVVPQGTSLIAVSVILHTFAFLLFTALGMLLGLLLNGLEERSPAGGLGSPNQSFTAFILIATAIAIAPFVAIAPRWRAALLASALLFAGVFAWLVPYLATWAPTER